MLSLLIAAILAQTPTPTSPSGPHPIRIDGAFDDWANVPAALSDPADATDAFVDLGTVKVADDGRYVYFLIDFGREVNPHVLDGIVFMPIDVDGNEATGVLEYGLPGADIVVEFSGTTGAKRRKAGEGVGLWSVAGAESGEAGTIGKLTPYDAGISFSPAYSTRQIEMRIDRTAALPDTPPLFHGASFRAKLEFADLNGKTCDEADAFSAALSHPTGEAPRRAITDATLKKSDDSLRVMSWNIQRGAIFDHPEPFARAMKLFEPDVVMLVELKSSNSAAEVQSWLANYVPAGESRHWSVVFGEGGGDLRTAVAARSELSVIDSMRTISRENAAGKPQTLRTATAVLSWKGKRIAFTALHTKCCGRSGSGEDLTRLEETAAISEAWKTAMKTGTFDGVVFAGDFNLVGSFTPLQSLLSGHDTDGSDLVAADAYQLDGLTNATWSDPGEPFVPGRLDFVIYSDSTLSATNAWVYDSVDIPASLAEPLGIKPEDSAAASDHMPVIVDLRIKS